MENSRTWRPLIMGSAAIASNHPAATQAGQDVLRKGGSAADAAVAVSLCLSVAEPFMSGLGGDGFFHVFDKTSVVYEAVGCAPVAASAERYGGRMPDGGPLAISPPGMLTGLAAMHASHGKLPFRSLVEPAIALARNGVFVGHTYRRYAASDSWRFKGDASAAAIYLEDEKIPDVGARVINIALADTLEKLARNGVEDFYRGDLADSLISDLANKGSIITKSDLASVSVQIREAIGTRYRGYDVLQTPPASTGFALLHELAILEHFEMADLFKEPDLLVHVMVEAKKLAFLERERYAGDPAFLHRSLDELFEHKAIDRMASRIRFDTAADLPIAGHSSETNTTYFCVADSHGQVVSAIQSLNSPFGSGVFLPSTGVLMNNRMTCWHLQDDHPNALSAGKKVRHTMNAPIILKDGDPWAAFGTPGADNQVQVNFQAAVSLIDLGMDPQQTVEAPRWSSDQLGQNANWPHAGDNLLTVEADFPPTVLSGLARRGHKLKVVPPLEGPCSLEIIRVLHDGTKVAGSDPRRDGWAAACD